MLKIDTHTHCFPDKLAERTLSALSARANSKPHGDGTYGGLVKDMNDAGLSGALILHIATKPAQMTNVNRFASECQKGNVLCFGSVYPTVPEALPELDRIKALGLRGVKLHPDYQDFYVDDPAVQPVYARAAELGLPVAFHTGRDPLCPDNPHCTPKMLGEVAERFPNLTIIAAHLGGMEMTDDAEKYLVGRENVYLDTAFATWWLSPARAAEVIRRHGVERVFFATDYPWSTVETEEAFLRQAGLREDELRLILGENAARVFGFSKE